MQERKGTGDVVRRLIEPILAGGSSSQLSSGASAAIGTGSAKQFEDLSKSMSNLISASQIQSEALITNTQAVTQNTTTRQTGSSVASTIGGMAGNVLGGGFGLSPLLSSLLGLFGGGNKSEPPPPLVKYSAPPAIQFESANMTSSEWGGLPALDYNQSGSPRNFYRPGSESGAQTPAAQQITVQVQTMDSRSFLDHSAEIARAVRDAMLNMHSVNDVIADL